MRDIDGLCANTRYREGDMESELLNVRAPCPSSTVPPKPAVDIGSNASVTPWTQVLELTNGPVVLIDQAATILGTNERADEILRQGDGIREHAGRLTLCSPNSHSAIRDRLHSSDTVHPTHVLVAQRRHATRPLLLTMTQGSRLDEFPMNWLVRVVDVETPPNLRTDVLRQLFKLTPKEVEVASFLARGYSLREIALALHISGETVRSHVKHLLMKTGTNRQSQLVRLLLLTTI